MIVTLAVMERILIVAGKSVKGGKYDKVPADYDGTVYTCPMHPEVRALEIAVDMWYGAGARNAYEEDTSELDT